MSDELARIALDGGKGTPYDAPDAWDDDNDRPPPPPAKDWAHAAARGIEVKTAPKRKKVPTCTECGVELGEGEVDVCNTCKEIDGRIAARRAEREKAA